MNPLNMTDVEYEDFLLDSIDEALMREHGRGFFSFKEDPQPTLWTDFDAARAATWSADAEDELDRTYVEGESL